MTNTTDTAARTGFHAEAKDSRGWNLPDRIWGWDMPVLGDFDDLASAQAWAARQFVTDSRVEQVEIVRHEAKPYGAWRYAGHVETIDRAAAPRPVYTIAPDVSANHLPGDDCWMVVAPEGAAGVGYTYAGRQFAQRAADKLNAGG